MLCSHSQTLFGSESADDHVGWVMDVSPHPLRRTVMNIFRGAPVVLLQIFELYRSSESLHVGILLGIAGFNMFQPDAPLVSPVPNCFTDVFRVIDATNYLGLSPPRDDLFEFSNDLLRR